MKAIGSLIKAEKVTLNPPHYAQTQTTECFKKWKVLLDWIFCSTELDYECAFMLTSDTYTF